MTEESTSRLLLICDDPARATAVRTLLDSRLLSVCRISSSETVDCDASEELALFVVSGEGDDDLVRLRDWVERHPDREVVALTNGEAPAFGTHAIACGAAAWLPLSAEPDSFRAALRQVIDRLERAARVDAEQQRLRELLDRAPIGVFELRDGRVTHINDHLLQRLGYGREELIDKAPKELDLIAPQDRGRMRRAVDDRLAGEDGSEAAIYQFTTKSGGTYIGEVRGRVVTTPNGPILQGTIRDITLETRLSQSQRIVIELGEVILGESDIKRILQLVLDAITEYSGFRRAVLSLYDLSIPAPFEGEVFSILSSGLTPEERETLLSQPPMTVSERKLVFSDRYRLGPAYYIPHDDTPWSEERGISGSVSVEGWHPDDFLFLPLRGTSGIIGSISVDDPIDRSAPTVSSIEPVAALANFAALAVERVFKMRRLQQQKEKLHGLSRFGDQLARVHDVRSLCELAVQRLHTDTDYGVCSICIADGMRLVQEAVAAKDIFSPDEIPQRGARSHVDGPGITCWAFRNVRSVIVPDVLQDERYDGSRKTIRSFMAVPITGRKGVIGVIDVASKRLAAFDEQDIEVVSALASQISTAISALQLRDSLLRIYSFGQRLATASTSDQAITGTLDFLVEQFDFELSSILLARDDGSLSVAGLRGPYHSGGIEVGKSLPLDAGIIGWAASNRQALLVPDVRTEPLYYEAFSGTRSELAVPVLFGGKLLGVLNVESQQVDFFDDADRQLLEVIANHLAIALANLASQDILREQAIRDPLTGLYNRHYFNSIVASELSRADRYGRPLSLMMIDVDGFRSVNNAFGHLRGDEVLREIARMLEGSVRSADRVIRYGGDEFLVLMPETDGAGEARTASKRLRTRIRQIPAQVGIEGHTIDLSIGFYTRPPRDERSLEAILEEVDRRMYADKRSKHGDASDD